MGKSNEFYTIAKIAGIKLCEAYKKEFGDNFISVQPNNIYGPRDKFSESSVHVMAALITKIHQAKKSSSPKVVCWGTGDARREFIYVEDLADAIVFVMNHYNDSEPINLASGKETKIKEIATIIKNQIDYKGKIVWDKNMPVGPNRRNVSIELARKKINFNPKISLQEGVKKTVDWYISSKNL